ncbi:MAG: hypothetical protein HRU17_08050 [Polyangiaceae bacterium]|nr:hypothetical protein [Polyangiaceae bacterium]
MTRLQTAMNQGPSRTRRSRGQPFDWRMVSGCLEEPDTRELAMAYFKTLGFKPDDFGHLRLAQEAAVSSLTLAEDWLESVHPGRRRERASIREVRRQLEVALWK